jgi:hypothetical protein
LKLLDLQMEKDNKTGLKDFIKANKVQSLLQLAHHNIGVNIRAYDDMLERAHRIIAMIDKSVEK